MHELSRTDRMKTTPTETSVALYVHVEPVGTPPAFHVPTGVPSALLTGFAAL